MPSFPVDAPLERVIKAFERLGFRVVRRGNHIGMIRENRDGSKTPLTLPSHRNIKGTTLRHALTQSKVPRESFLNAYEKS